MQGSLTAFALLVDLLDDITIRGSKLSSVHQGLFKIVFISNRSQQENNVTYYVNSGDYLTLLV